MSIASIPANLPDLRIAPQPKSPPVRARRSGVLSAAQPAPVARSKSACATKPPRRPTAVLRAAISRLAYRLAYVGAVFWSICLALPRYIGLLPVALQVDGRKAAALFAQRGADLTERHAKHADRPLCASCVVDAQRDMDVRVHHDGLTYPLEQASSLDALAALLRLACDDDDAWVQAVSSHLNQALPAIVVASTHALGRPFLPIAAHGWSYWVERRGDRVDIVASYAARAQAGQLATPNETLRVDCPDYSAYVRVSQPHPSRGAAKLQQASVVGTFSSHNRWWTQL